MQVEYALCIIQSSNFSVKYLKRNFARPRRERQEDRLPSELLYVFWPLQPLECVAALVLVHLVCLY